MVEIKKTQERISRCNTAVVGEPGFGNLHLCFIEFLSLGNPSLLSSLYPFCLPTFYLSSLLSGAWTEIENYSKPDL